MRTLTSAESNILSLTNRSNHLKVSIYANSQWYDMTNLDGYNWVISYSQNRTVDDFVSSASIVLWKKIYNLNLATLVDGSKLNASGVIVDVPHEIKVETATLGENTLPSSSDWKEVFRGYIEEIDWSSDKIRLNCLDKSTNLNQNFIETQQIYGTAAKTTYLEEEIQDILDDNNTGFTLYSPNGTSIGGVFAGSDSTFWLVGKWKQGKQPVFQAIQRLAQQIGFEIRYKWHEDSATPGDSAFQLVMSQPERKVAARGTITVTGDFSVSDTFTINSTAFTCVSGTPSDDEFNNVSGDTQSTCDNIVTMLRDSGCTEVDNIEAWRVGSTVIIEWKVAGTAGNSITFTESISAISMDGGGTLGGTVAGTDGPTTPSRTFSDSDYESINRCSISRADVRNAVKVTYEIPSTKERVTVVREDAPSIAKYGRRYMELTEASGSQIDTTDEASLFAQACLQDLMEPLATISVKLPYFWAMELNDLIRLSSDDDHFDSNQDLAVVSISDNFDDNSATTTVELRGKPTGGVKRWIELDGRPGVAPGQDLFSDPALVPSVEVGLSTIIVKYDDPRTQDPSIDDWSYTECHVSTTSGFTPSTSTLVAVGKQTRFEVNGLLPGTTYYVKLVMYDQAGNASSTSTQVFGTAQKVAPYHEDENREHGVLLLNGDFGSQTLAVASNLPDYWNEDDQQATGTISITGDISTSDTFVINNTTFTCVASSPGTDEFLNSPGSPGQTAVNIRDMLRSGSESGNILATTSPVPNSVVVAWKEPGTAGNSITFTESLTNATMNGSGTLGGTYTGSQQNKWTSAFDISNTMHQTGNRSILFNNTDSSTMVSDFIPIKPDRIYKIQTTFYQDSFSVSNLSVIRVNWYDEYKQFLTGNSDFQFNQHSDAGSWVSREALGVTPNTDARYCRVELLKQNTVAYNLYIDKIHLIEMQPAFNVYPVSRSYSNTSWTTINFDSRRYEYGRLFFDLTNDYYTIQRSGYWVFEIDFDLTTGNNVEFRIRKDTGSGFNVVKTSNVYITGSSGNANGQWNTGPIQLNENDKIDIQIYHSSGGSKTLTGNTTFEGTRVSLK